MSGTNIQRGSPAPAIVDIKTIMQSEGMKNAKRGLDLYLVLSIVVSALWLAQSVTTLVIAKNQKPSTPVQLEGELKGKKVVGASSGSDETAILWTLDGEAFRVDELKSKNSVLPWIGSVVSGLSLAYSLIALIVLQKRAAEIN